MDRNLFVRELAVFLGDVLAKPLDILWVVFYFTRDEVRHCKCHHEIIIVVSIPDIILIYGVSFDESVHLRIVLRHKLLKL